MASIKPFANYRMAISDSNFELRTSFVICHSDLVIPASFTSLNYLLRLSGIHPNFPSVFVWKYKSVCYG